MATVTSEQYGKYICTFLDMLAHSEGTDQYPNDGYNTIVGGEQFDSYADHPRVYVYLPNLKIKSSAAGRYQLLARYFDAYRGLLNLDDFSPLSQDLIAIQQIRERKALSMINDGNIEGAIEACSNIWASLPGAGYKQHENKLSELMDFFNKGIA